MHEYKEPKSLIEACAMLVEQKKIVVALEKPLTEAKEVKTKLEYKILEFLDMIDQKSVINEYGRFTKVNKTAYSAPSDTEDKKKFFEYVKENGYWDDLFIMNGTSFNGVMEKIKKDNAHDELFLPPGIQDKKPFFILSTRKV